MKKGKKMNNRLDPFEDPEIVCLLTAIENFNSVMYKDTVKNLKKELTKEFRKRQIIKEIED